MTDDLREVLADDERIFRLVAAVEAGEFDALDAAADQWAESAGVQRMMNAIASVFEKHASQEIMDRFREKLGALMHLAWVEGAAQGVMQVSPILRQVEQRAYERAARHLEHRAGEYRASMIGLNAGQAAFQCKMIDELHNEAAAIRHLAAPALIRDTKGEGLSSPPSSSPPQR